MTATYKGEDRGRSFTTDTNGGLAIRAFTVESDDPNESDVAVESAIPVNYGDPHPQRPSIFAFKFESKQDDTSWRKWTVDVEYSPPQPPSVEDLTVEPLSRDPIISYSSEEVNYTALGTVNVDTGELEGVYKTSADEPYDPQPVEEDQIITCLIQRNENENFSVQLWYNYTGALNSDIWTIGDLSVAPGFAKMKIAIGGKQKWTNPNTGEEVIYRTVQYTIRCNPLGWDITLADAGWQYLQIEGTPPITKVVQFRADVLDENDEPTGQSVPRIGFLDGTGKPLPEGQPPVFNTFTSKKRLPFAALNLPPGP